VSGPVHPGPDPDRYDPDAVVAYRRAGRPVPPVDPLAGSAPDPRALTAAEREAVELARSRATWYRDDEAVADVRLLLGLLDRSSCAPVDRYALLRPGDHEADDAVDDAVRRHATRAARRNVAALRRLAADAPDGTAALLGRLDGLRAELDVLADDLLNAWSAAGRAPGRPTGYLGAAHEALAHVALLLSQLDEEAPP